MSSSAVDPRVLVGIPTKDRPSLVTAAVQSVLRQKFGNFRVIVSDNRSDAEASASVRDYVRGLNDPRVGYILQPVDAGEYGQGRYLIEQCKEEYFVILHDDDMLEPEHIAYCLRILDADPELAFVSTSQHAIDENGADLPSMTDQYNEAQGRHLFDEGRIDNVLETLFRYGGLFSISGTVFRTSAVHEAGLVDPDCGGLYPFEFNVFLRQAEQGRPAYFTSHQLVAYRHHEGAMRNYARPFYNRTMMSTMIKLLERRRFTGWPERRRRQLLAGVYRNFAYILYIANERLDCYLFLVRALKMNPISWSVWAYAGFAVFLPFLIRPIWGRRVTL